MDSLSIIYFKLAEITNGNELKNSKYGYVTIFPYRLQATGLEKWFLAKEKG